MRSVFAPPHDAVSPRGGKATISDRLARPLVFRVKSPALLSSVSRNARRSRYKDAYEQSENGAWTL